MKKSYETNQKLLMLAFYTILKPKRNVYYDVKLVKNLKDINFNDNNDKRNYLVVLNCDKGCKIQSLD